VNEANFQIGIDEGMWGIVNHDEQYPSWPFVIIWVKAKQKANAPDRYYFRFDLANYPVQAPTACPWNINTNNRLDNHLWPTGGRIVSFTFKPSWNPNALYAPCDRIAMTGHEPWKQQFPELWWRPHFKITVYLHFLHRLLNSTDYAR
jgi:hypothetical protein